MNAGCMGTVNRAIFDTGTVLGRLGDGVHFSMDGAKAVLLGVAVRCLRLIDQATDISAMWHPCRRSVVTGGENVFVTHDHGPNLCPAYRRPLGNLKRNGHEILIPAQPLAHD